MQSPIKQGYVEKARAAGWTETTAFDYQQFTRTGDHDAEYHGAAKVYEWDDEYGDVGPEVPELKQILFGGENQMGKGEHIGNLQLEVGISGPTKVQPIAAFIDAGLHPVVLSNIQLPGYDRPTAIQCYTIPACLLGHDIVGIAQTGSGKTAAFFIPILSKLMGKAKRLSARKPNIGAHGAAAAGRPVRAEPLVVVVVPTRELAMQLFDEARRMCYRSMLRPCVVYGGLPMHTTIQELGKGCDILIATPGRLCDLMDKPNILTMSRVKYTVIDEADEMVQCEWEQELRKIMSGGDTNEDADHVYMMFSATFSKTSRQLAREYLAQDYVQIRVGRPGQAHKNIRQNIIFVDQDKKREAIYDLLFQLEVARTLIFCNSKIQVDILDDFLFNRGMPTTSIHSDRNQREREDAIRAFRTGKAPIMIATGVSARGWDVAGIKHVINFDLPSTMRGGIQEYVHRVGRTARIGHQGLATSLYNERNEDMGQDLVNILAECDCAVPEFLQHLTPEDGKAMFDDDKSDDEADAVGDYGATTGVGGGFGDTSNDAGGEAVDSAWGAAAPAVEDAGFAADTRFTADGSNGAGQSDW